MKELFIIMAILFVSVFLIPKKYHATRFYCVYETAVFVTTSFFVLLSPYINYFIIVSQK